MYVCVYVCMYVCVYVCMYVCIRAQTNLVQFENSEQTFECSLSNSNFAINSMQKCALISKVEKWHPYLEELLHMFPVQVMCCVCD